MKEQEILGLICVLYDYDPNFRARYLLENMDDLSTNLTQCGNIFESFKHEPSCGTGGFQHGLYKREYNALKEYMMSRL